jgi:ribosomal protein S18 acetylase RimI-like enzyme
MVVQVDRPGSADLTELAAVAAATFPLACPPSAPSSDIAAFIASSLTEEHFAGYLTDPDRAVFVARGNTGEGRILGYTMLIAGEPDDADVRRAVPLRPAIELSKMYMLPRAHGTGAAGALMTTTVQYATDRRARCIWLGVNQENQRAQRFYIKCGYTVSGTKTFQLGDRIEHDYVLMRRLP